MIRRWSPAEIGPPVGQYSPPSVRAPPYDRHNDGVRIRLVFRTYAAAAVQARE